MKVLVTGSTGFIGAQLCRALIAQGHEVRAFHRATSTLRLIEDLPVEHALGDLTQPQTVQAAMQDIEVVFHAAALLSGQLGRMYTVTVEGTRTLLQAARLARVRRVVHTSSVAALGVPDTRLSAGLPGPVLMDERHTWNYRSDYYPYGYAKYLAELEVQRAVAQGLDVVIVNPTYVIGAGDVYRQTSSLVMQIARRRIPLMVEGGINVVHIADVVAGHLAALARGATGQRYILGGENMTYQYFAQRIALAAGVPPPALMLPAGVAHRISPFLNLARSFISLPVEGSMLRLAGYTFYYDTRKAQVGLGLGQPRPVDAAIREAYDWFRQMGLK